MGLLKFAGSNKDKDNKIKLKSSGKNENEGLAQELTEEGLELCKLGRYRKANECFERAAELGSARAYNCLGVSYRDGEGIKADIKKAIDCFERALEGGYKKAASNLMILYYLPDEYKIERDDERLYKYSIISSEIEDPLGYTLLSACYYYGMGCECNHKLSAYWGKRAVDAGENAGYDTLAKMFSCGEYLVKCPAFARYCYNKLSKACGLPVEKLLPDSGESNALILSSRPIEPVYPYFNDSEPDFFTAPDPEMLYLEGLEYLFGKTNGQTEKEIDASKGLELLEAAAKQGCAKSMVSIANRYLDVGDEDKVTYYDDGSVKAFGSSYEISNYYYCKAAEYGSEDALDALAILHTVGDAGFEQDAALADQYWIKYFTLYQCEGLKKQLGKDGFWGDIQPNSKY